MARQVILETSVGTTLTLAAFRFSIPDEATKKDLLCKFSTLIELDAISIDSSFVKSFDEGAQIKLEQLIDDAMNGVKPFINHYFVDEMRVAVWFKDDQGQTFFDV